MKILDNMLGRAEPPMMAATLKVLSHLLGYPNRELRAHLPELREALRDEGALGAARLAEVDSLIDRLAGGRGIDGEMAYVEIFDRGRSTSLNLFEHVHGDSRDRGPAMIDLVQTYEAAGLLLDDGELPDYLPVVLQYASTQPPAQAAAFLGEIADIVRAIFSALLKRESPYACLLGALLELAGEKAQPVSVRADEDLDESWEEPLAFDGCSIKGQGASAGSGVPDIQPIEIHRRPPSDQNIATRA